MPMNPNEILAFMNGFYGYGNPAAALWFIGYEERGVESEREARIDQWLQMPLPRKFVDVHTYHEALGLMTHLDANARYQRTWGQLSRLTKAALGEPLATLQAVKDYQGNHLGRALGDTLLTELFPLPNRSTNTWIWEDQTCAALPYLQNRPAYELAAFDGAPQPNVLHSRAAGLQEMIAADDGPSVVVAYGLQAYRNDLFGGDWTGPVIVGGVGYHHKMLGETLVVSCVHPNYRRRGQNGNPGVAATNAYFSAIGTFVSQYL